MPIETATYVSQLNPSYPLLSDTVESLGPQINLLKTVLQNTFPNLSTPLATSPSALAIAAGAFNNGVLTVPAPTTGSASLVLTGSATAGSTVSIEAGAVKGTGFAIVSQGPAKANGTLPAAVPELTSDGSGDIVILTSLSTPVVSATSEVTAPTINATTFLQGGNPLIPRGIITLWYGSVGSIPAGWVLCNGSNGTPDLRDSFVIGAGGGFGVNTTGGASSVTLSTANLPAHTHNVVDPGHTHSITDPGHNHNLTDPGHNHAVVDPGHSHSLGGISGSNLNTGSGPFAVTGSGNSVSTSTSGTGISISSHTTGITSNGSTTGISNVAATTGIYLGSTGSGTSFSIVPPYYALCYIMKS